MADFNNMLNEDEMKDAVAAVLVGKQDLPNAMPTAEVTPLYYGYDELHLGMDMAPALRDSPNKVDRGDEMI